MVFSSLLFIFIYLVVTLALYYAVPNRVYRNVILCVLSLIFYGWGEPSFVLLMIFSIAFNWLAGLLVGKYRKTLQGCTRCFRCAEPCAAGRIQIHGLCC